MVLLNEAHTLCNNYNNTAVMRRGDEIHVTDIASQGVSCPSGKVNVVDETIKPLLENI